MQPIRAVLAVSFVLAGCASQAAISSSLRQQTAPAIACPSDQIEVGEHDVTLEGAGTAYSTARVRYPASGCGRSYTCESVNGSARCTETAASEERSVTSLVIDRLALETGCPAERIAVVQQAGWARGHESAFRLTACGKSYVCSSAPGRVTECKAALAQ